MASLEGRQKAAYVQAMFSRIAARYDLMNRLMTLGQDRRWRRYAVQQAQLSPGARLLDVATGTGDIAFEALRQQPTTQVTGADFAMPMMQVGRRRSLGAQVRWCDADALNLPFPPATFDAVTSAYLLRNVPDIQRALAEQMRVLKPGGRVVSLDTSPPPRGPLRPLILFHFKVIIPLLGRLIARDPSAYTYLPESTQAFKEAEELAHMMRQAGFQDVQYRKFMFGTMAAHSGTKPESARL